MLGLVVVLGLGACSTAAVRQEEAQRLKSSEINTELGLSYLRKGDTDRALLKLTRALEQNPDNPKAHAAIALVYDNLDRKERARQHYARAVELSPDDSYGLNAYGAFLCREGAVDEALKYFARAVDNPLYPQPEVALTNAGQCARSKNDLEQAETYFRAALRRNATFAPALYQMSRLSYETGRALSARGYLQRYLAVAKHTAQTLWLGIQIERELGDRDTVATYSLLLRRQFPDSEEARLLLKSDPR
ncbi:MAG: PilW family type IVa pilus biogenesis/stability lipoprotein TapF [Gammaproteobacteria bacterium]